MLAFAAEGEPEVGRPRGDRAAGVDPGGAPGLDRPRGGRRRSAWSAAREPRPRRAPGHARRAARRLRGDGRGAGALGPLGQHQGAPRLLHRPVRPPGPDGHAGRAHPRPPGRDALRGGRGGRGGALPGRRLDPQRPLQGRHPPARRDGGLPRVRLRGAGGVRGQPRPPRRHRGQGARFDAGGLALAGGGGRGDRADAPREGGRAGPRPARRPHHADAQPAPARGRPARPARGQPGRRRAAVRAGGVDGHRTRCATASTRPRTTPSAGPGRASRRWARASGRRSTCSRPPRATWSCG